MKHLLQACLLPPDAALGAYERWRQETDFERLEPAEFALLPYLYKHLEPHFLATDPLLPRLRGVYKQAWLRQQQRLMQQQEFLRQHPNCQLLEDAALDICAVPAVVGNAVPFVASTKSVVVLVAPMPLWMHRLRVASDPIWLVQCFVQLHEVADWQPFFDAAQDHGLRKRLFVVLKKAMRFGLLEPRTLPKVFSLHDHLTFWRTQHPSRWGRGLARLILWLCRH
jgi:hypothetical protein